MAISPAQTSFARGALSPRLHGRFDSPGYAAGLAEAVNFMVEPQGPIRKRAGTVLAGEEVASSRLVPFRVSGTADDYVLALSPGRLRIYSQATGQLVPIKQNLITNGHFDSGLAGWTTVAAAVSWDRDAAKLEFSGGGLVAGRIRQQLVLAAGIYEVSFSVTSTSQIGNPYASLYLNGVESILNVSTAKSVFTFEYVTPGGALDVEFEIRGGVAVWVDDVTVTRVGATVLELAGPWGADHLAGIQSDGEPTKNRALLVHGELAPHVVVFTAPSTWELYPATFVNTPPSWGGGNWPSVVEVGFQGRMWLGATPNEPNTFWGSRSGKAFDFTAGANPDDALSWIVSTKGALRWMKGKTALLMGSEAAVHSLSSSSGLITQSDFGITDETGFGAAAVQAIAAGDEVLFVTRDRRHVREVGFSQERGGWVSRALTEDLEHLTAGRLKELHVASSPDRILVGVLEDGGIVAATVIGTPEGTVLAGWEVDVGGVVGSGAIAEGADGAELWLAVTRQVGGVDRHFVERLPLHEEGAVYLDSAVVGVVAANGTVGGLAHLEGEVVGVVVRGAVKADQVVAGGAVQAVSAEQIADDATLVGAEVVVGLPFEARAVTLPPEGGNPRGSAQVSKRRRVRIFVRLNRSALPLLNGERPDDRTPATPQDTPEPLTTGDVDVTDLGWDENGVVTITQDLPLRTEVLALFGTEAVNQI